MDEGIIKMLECKHEVTNVLLIYNNIYYNKGTPKKTIKTEVLKMVCSKCKELITKEYVIDVGNVKI